MVTEELKKYIIESLRFGKEIKDIQQTLLATGWQEVDIREAFQELGIVKKISNFHFQGKAKAWQLIIYSTFICAIAVLGSTTFYLWQNRLDLSDTNAQKVREFYTRLAQSQISFIDSGEMVFPDEQKFFLKKPSIFKIKIALLK